MSQILQTPQFSEEVPEWIRQALHTGTKDHVSNPRPKLGEIVKIRLELPTVGKPDQVVLRTIPNGEQQLASMRFLKKQGRMNIWEGELLVNEPRVPYRFAIQTEGRIWWLNALGVSRYMPVAPFDFLLLANTEEIDWLSKSVFYQIFPDRFANGDPTNDPNGEIEGSGGVLRKTYPWGVPGEASLTKIPFYGGDLKGIEQHLDYLERLGVNALYLNPIFSAYTNHRYDVVDFRNVDQTLGGNEALISLRQALDEHKMKLILDIVPNHSGARHPWFLEAKQGPASPKRASYFFDEADNYVSWMGFGSLPKLNYSDPELRSEMYEDEKSVFASWLLPPYNIDGWRVDVGNMLGRLDEQQLDGEVLPAIRKTVKATKPQSYLMGENFFQATGQLQGDAWDGVMNYSGFSDPLLNWLAGFQIHALGNKTVLHSEKPLGSDQLVRTWQENLAAIPWTIALQQFNLLDSHDTERLRTRLKGDEYLIRLALMVQFTFPGIPCIYYGDEIGLADEEGFAQRNCFPWDESLWDCDLLAFYQKLIELRKNSEVLAQGSFQVLYWDENLLIYQRQLQSKRIILSACKTDQKEGFVLQTDLVNPNRAEKLKNLFSGEDLGVEVGELRFPSLKRGGAIWL
ncbi:MAG: hypothetical protein KBA03_00040 [Anaerolineaceae bacterium]|nr:hypothetical protein [Anaerolineaceae bacterium]